MGDHTHIGISIPPKYAGSKVMGLTKGKSLKMMARQLGKKQGILNEKVFGREAIPYQQLGWMRRSLRLRKKPFM